MKPAMTAEDAYAVCEDIAESRATVTARNAYGDGYRAAAEHIVSAIRAKRSGRVSSDLERDLRDAEVEARTFARMIEAAAVLVEKAGAQTEAADTVRMLLGGFFSDDDLPHVLRKRERASGTTLLERSSRTQRVVKGARGERKLAVARSGT